MATGTYPAGAFTLSNGQMVPVAGNSGVMAGSSPAAPPVGASATGVPQIPANTNASISTIDPYLAQYFGSVQNGWNQGGSSNWGAPYTGPTVTPMSGQTQSALGMIQDIASGPNEAATLGMEGVRGLLDTSQWQSLYDQSGFDAAPWQELFQNSGNEAFGGVLDTQAGKLTDDINRGYSASGRYGSASHSGALAGQVGDFRAKASADNFNQMVANQANILGNAYSAQNASTGLRSNILGNMGQQTATGIGMLPGLNNLQYAGADRLATVGAAYDDLTTRQLTADKALWDAQHSPNGLQAYGGLLGLPGSSGSTYQTSTVQEPTNYAEQAAGVLGAGTGIAGILGSLFGGAGSAATDWTGGVTGLLY